MTPDLPGPCESFPVDRQETTLSDVIDAPASAGDIVFIYPGTYTDTPVVDIADLFIKSVEGPEVTIFDGEASSDAALTVSAGGGGIVLDGFTFTHSDGGDGGGVDAAGSPNEICGFESRDEPSDPIVPDCDRAMEGDFTMKNSIASGNLADSDCDDVVPTCYGVKVIMTGLVTFENVEASGNGSENGHCTGHGYELTKKRGRDGESCFGIMAYSLGSDVVMSDIEANGNRAVAVATVMRPASASWPTRRLGTRGWRILLQTSTERTMIASEMTFVSA